MFAAVMIASMLWGPSAAKANNDAVGALRCGTAQEVLVAPDHSLDPAYVQRSVAIIREALAEDATRLSNVVSADAAATFFQYDNGVSSPDSGPRAIIRMIGRIQPRPYEFFEPRGLPGPSRKPCGPITIRLTLKPAEQSKAFLATFKYERGLLVELILNDANYSAGEIGQSAPRGGRHSSHSGH